MSRTSPAVKRLMREAQELKDATELFYAQPIEDNLFEWHFTIRGPSDSDFDGGVFHGRILLPPEYPMKPPSIMFLTHNGRFKVNEKICLSISGHHPETWLPSWSIRTALLALIGFMPTHGEGALGSLDYTPEERKQLARKSLAFKCSVCNTDNAKALPIITEKSQHDSNEAKILAAQISFKNKPTNETQTPAADTKDSTAESTLRQRNTEPVTTPPTSSQTVASIQPDLNESLINHQVNISSTLITPHRLIITILTLIFVFLLIRRLLMIFGSEDTSTTF